PEDEQTLQKAISDISSYVQNLQRDLQFQVDTDLGRTVISVVDSKTKEVIRQIPSEEVLARARFLEAQAADSDASDGLLLQVKT
ncbi:MAG TPA: flagellar protein FlaG, partial [Gammaproteobacteria bacterium]|nr:flagellar protein FlaG [Gammaproteobacteria bacterium]